MAPTAEATAPEPSATVVETATEAKSESISSASTGAQAEAVEVQPESHLATLPSKTGVGVAEAQEASFPVVRVIKQGQTLFRLTKEVYGHADPQLVEWVKENNPSIRDITRIPAGTEIVFPTPR